jgi:hypothetical protein
MSYFKFGYPTIQSIATASANLTASTTRPLTNLFSGSRSERFEVTIATTTNLIVSYDLGVGVTKSVNFIAIMRAKLLKANNCSTVQIYGNSSAAMPGSPLYSLTLSSATLMGPNDEDYFEVVTETTAFRYWWLALISNGTATTYPVSKVFFGKALDLGREPQLPISILSTRQNAWSRETQHTVSLTFDPVKDTEKETFLNDLMQNADVLPLVALDPSQVALNDTKGMHCKITDHNVEPSYSIDNKITITLEEEI